MTVNGGGGPWPAWQSSTTNPVATSVAVLAAIGSSDPQVAAHIRALRALEVPWNEIEETILQVTPYAGIPRAINAMKVLRAQQEAAE
jgi:alkylhydroperoxidase/carboxymuconolactone decarboxylase family protein YurZ